MSKVSPPWDPIRWREVRPDARQKMKTHVEQQQVEPEIKSARPSARGSTNSKPSHGSKYQGVKLNMNTTNAKVEAGESSRQSPPPTWKNDQNSLAPSASARPRASLASPRLVPADATTSNQDNATDHRRRGHPSPTISSWHPDYRRDSSVTVDRSVASHHSETATSLNKLSLPSLASFHEGVWRQDTSAMTGNTATSYTPNSAVSPSCWCSRLVPMVHSAARMARGLESTLRVCAPNIANRFEFQPAPSASPIDTLQWIIDTLSLVGQDATNAETMAYVDTTHGAKRPGTFDEESRKRARRDTDRRLSATPPASSSRTNDHAKYHERRTPSSPVTLPSLDLTHSKANIGNTRLLPSPSSLVHSASGVPMHNFTDHVSPPGSARLSNLTSSSMHQGSSAAASQHIADLQHQISVKTLALESLQKEHTNLLQKWHRERVKIHAIEKKCQVSDQEINDLTGKHEDALENIKILEAQVANQEGRREADSTAFTREKEQWSRMLEMSGRLHLKVSEERKRLLEDNAALEKRVLWFEQESLLKHGRTVESDGSNTPAITATASGHGELPPFGSLTESRLLSNQAASVANALQSQVENLRAALEDARQQNTSMEQASRSLLAQQKALADAIEKALVPADDEHTTMEQTASHMPTNTSKASIEQDSTSGAPDSGRVQPLQQPRSAISHAQNAEKRHVANILKSVGSKSSPIPAELGIEVMPSKSSPEEMIIALGPVPGPSNASNSSSRGSEFTSMPAHASQVHRTSPRRNEYTDFLEERPTSVTTPFSASVLATSQG